MVKPSSCIVKEGVPSSQRYLPAHLRTNGKKKNKQKKKLGKSNGMLPTADHQRRPKRPRTERLQTPTILLSTEPAQGARSSRTVTRGDSKTAAPPGR